MQDSTELVAGSSPEPVLYGTYPLSIRRYLVRRDGPTRAGRRVPVDAQVNEGGDYYCIVCISPPMVVVFWTSTQSAWMEDWILVEFVLSVAEYVW